MHDNNRHDAAAKTARPVLRIVRNEPAVQNTVAVDAEVAKTKPKSRTAQFMTAYADAIDRDIKLLLDL